MNVVSVVCCFIVFMIVTLEANPILKSLETGIFQGDIILTPDQDEYLHNPSVKQARTGLLETRYKWPKNQDGFVLLPYTISDAAGFSETKLFF